MTRLSSFSLYSKRRTVVPPSGATIIMCYVSTTVISTSMVWFIVNCWRKAHSQANVFPPLSKERIIMYTEKCQAKESTFILMHTVAIKHIFIWCSHENSIFSSWRGTYAMFFLSQGHVLQLRLQALLTVDCSQYLLIRAEALFSLIVNQRHDFFRSSVQM